MRSGETPLVLNCTYHDTLNEYNDMAQVWWKGQEMIDNTNEVVEHRVSMRTNELVVEGMYLRGRYHSAFISKLLG